MSSTARNLSSTGRLGSTNRPQELTARIESADRECSEAKQQFVELQQRSLREKAQLKATLSDISLKKNEAEQARKSAVNDSSIARRRFTELRTQFDVIQQKSQQEIASLERELQLTQRQVNDLQAQLTRLTDRFKASEDEIRKVEGDTASATDEGRELKAQLQQCRDRFTQVQKQAQDCRSSNMELRQRVDVAEATRNSEARDGARKIRQLEQGIATTRAKKQEVQAAANSAIDQVRRSEEECSTLREDVKQRRSELNSLESQAASMRKEVLSLTAQRLGSMQTSFSMVPPRKRDMKSRHVAKAAAVEKAMRSAEGAKVSRAKRELAMKEAAAEIAAMPKSRSLDSRKVEQKRKKQLESRMENIQKRQAIEQSFQEASIPVGSGESFLTQLANSEL